MYSNINNYKQNILHTIIPCIENEYTNRLRKIDDRIILTEKIGQGISFLNATEYLVKKGARIIQVIDESGIANIELIKQQFPQLIIIAGGAIDSVEKGQEYLYAGSDYIIISRYFTFHPEKINKLANKFKNKLIVSIDDKDGYLESNMHMSIFEYANILVENNIDNIVYVNSSIRLTNKKVSLERFKRIRSIFKNKCVIYSGGIRTTKDLDILKKTGADGIIAGTASYMQTFSLENAMNMFRRI